MTNRVKKGALSLLDDYGTSASLLSTSPAIDALNLASDVYKHLNPNYKQELEASIKKSEEQAEDFSLKASKATTSSSYVAFEENRLSSQKELESVALWKSMENQATSMGEYSA